MDFLFVMDPLERINPQTDTTWALMKSARAAGHRSYFTRGQDLSLVQGRAYARAREVQVPGAGGPFSYLSEAVVRAVESFEVTWLRTDPPFDLRYVETTWLLDTVDRLKTLLVNDPAGVRGANEKLYALRFGAYSPPTLVTADLEVLKRFVRDHREVVLKPLMGAGGEGILFAHQGMRGLNSLLEMATASGRRTLAQAYLPASDQGDLRVLLLEGECLGAVLRVHGEGEERNNLHLGGSAAPGVLDAKTLEIIAALAPSLRADGLHFVGIDVIGGFLTEVNVTSPTGIQEMERLDGVDRGARVISWCEAKVRKLQARLGSGPVQ